MTTIHIIMRDTEDGLVDVETTVTAWDAGSNALALAGRVNEFIASIAEDKTPKQLQDVVTETLPKPQLLTV